MESKLRPHVICHMMVSIDGKVTGDLFNEPECQRGYDMYFDIHKESKAKAFGFGRRTFELDFTKGFYPDLSKYSTSKIERKDFIVNDNENFYAVAFDRLGKLGWTTNQMKSEEYSFFNGAFIIEILSKEVNDAYLAYLQEKKISYIFAENISECLVKLKKYFGIDVFLLEGGSVINGAFAKEGLIDEISLVQCPFIIGPKGKPLFNDALIEKFSLQNIATKGNFISLRYIKEAK